VENESKHAPLERLSRRRSTLLLLLFNYGTLALVFVQGVILVPLYLRLIPREEYGAWLATGSLVSYLGLLDFGCATVLMQRVSSLHGSGDREKLGATIGSGLAAIAGLALGALAVGWTLSCLLSNILPLSPEYAPRITAAFRLATFGTAAMIVLYGFSSVSLGFQRQVYTGTVSLMGMLLSLGTSLFLLSRGMGSVALAAGPACRAAFSLLAVVPFVFCVVRRRLPGVSLRPRGTEYREVLGRSMWTSLTGLAGVVGGQSDALITARVLSTREVADFNLTKKAVDIVSMMCARIPASFIPALAHLIGENDTQRTLRVCTRVLKLNIVIAAVATGGALVLNDLFMGAWVGGLFFAGWTVSVVLAVAGFFALVEGTMAALLTAHGEMRTLGIAAIAEMIVRLGFSIILGMTRLGLAGIAFGAVLASILVGVPLRAFRLSKLLGYRAQQTAFMIFGAMLKTCLPLILVGGIRAAWRPSGLMPFLLLGTLYLFAAILTFLALDAEIRGESRALITWIRSHFDQKPAS
jgi:O-antigen/teichoic acid export membrane protein